jgi:polysaccharide biosynthesis protein PslH
MKLLFVTPGFVYPLIGGQSIRTYHFIKELAALGVDITVLTIEEPGSDGRAIESIRSFCSRIVTVPVDPDRPRSIWERMWLKVQPLPATMVRYRSDAFTVALERLLEKDTYGVLLCDQLHMASYCWRVSLPKILNTDDPLYIQLQRDREAATRWASRLKLGWEAWKYRRFERRMFAAFDRVLFVSARDRDLVNKDLGCTHIDIVPQGVDLKVFDPHGDDQGDSAIPDGPFILLSGMMNYGPNALAARHFVEQIWPEIHRQRPDVRCVIMGAYPTAEVQALANRHEGVMVTGFVDDVLPWLRAAAVYAAPALTGTGIKNKVLQAMAMEKGIVASRLSLDGIPQAQHTKDVLVADSPADFADACLHLLQHPDEAVELGRQARQTIERHYTWPAIVGGLYASLYALQEKQPSAQSV